MRRIVMLLLCCVVLEGCVVNEKSPNNNEKGVTSVADGENERTESGIVLPCNIETDEGIIKLSRILIEPKKTEHGYEGWLAIEFDLSNLNEDGQYWFDKDYSILISDWSFSDTDGNTIGLNDFSEIKSSIVDGKKYIFYLINENKHPMNDLSIALDVDVQKNHESVKQIQIRNKCSDFDIEKEFPKDISAILGEEIWKRK